MAWGVSASVFLRPGRPRPGVLSRNLSMPPRPPRDPRSSPRRGSSSGRPRPPGAPASRPSKPAASEIESRPQRPKPKNRPSGPEAFTPGHAERLQKVLARAGLGSRRACEELILKGRVAIDGEVAKVLGTRVDPTAARVTVDGEAIALESAVYYAVHKPKGYVSTNSDPAGRPRVIDLLPEASERIYSVGRLDEDSTGLILMTNDGELANRLAHPKYGVEKVYRALVAGLPGAELATKLTEGVWLSDGKVRAKRARILARQGQSTVVELVLAEGKKREIRRMLSKLGHKVMSLCRIAVGPIALKNLPVGESRSLTRNEIELLRKAAAGEDLSAPEAAGEGLSGRARIRARRPLAEHHEPDPEPRRDRRDDGPPRGRNASNSRPTNGTRPERGSRPDRPTHGAGPRPSGPPPRRHDGDQERRPPRAAHRRDGDQGPPPRRHPPRAGGAGQSGPPPSHSRPDRPGRTILGLEPESRGPGPRSHSGPPGRKRPIAIKRKPPRSGPGPKGPTDGSTPEKSDD